MKIFKKILISLIVISLLLQYSVSVLVRATESSGYTVILQPNKTAVAEGETLEITLILDDINVGDAGIGIYAGVIQYDINCFELIDIKGKGDWEKPITRAKALKEGETLQTVALTGDTKSGQGYTTRQEVAVITLKAIQDSTVGRTTFKTDKFQVSNGTTSSYPEVNPTMDLRVKGETINTITSEFGVVTIPEEIDNRAVTDIGSKVITDIENVTTIIIPDSVVEIADDAFADADGNIPTGITIECSEGSAAEQYAKDHNISYESTDKTIASIAVVPNTVKNQYAVNESLNTNGGKLELTYTDGSTSQVNMNKRGVSITGFDSSLGGNSTVTISYKEKTTTYDIEILKEMSRIEVTTQPTKTTYIQNYEQLDLTGGVVTVVYDDNTTDTVNLDNPNVTVTGFSNATVGTRRLTVEYCGKTTTFNVEITEKALRSIEIVEEPTKTTYIQNYEQLDLTGGKIKLTYDDNSTNIINMTAQGVTTTGFDNTTVGTKTVTVTYSGKSVSFDITVRARILTEIRVSTLPRKTIYLTNITRLDLTGGKITLVYDNNTTETLDMVSTDGIILDGLDVSFEGADTIGSKTVTVTYQGKQATFIVDITKDQVAYEPTEDGTGVKVTRIEPVPEDNPELVIPDTIGGIPVTEITDDIKPISPTVTTIYIPSSVTKIPDDLFDETPEITIECESGSYAEEYAREHGLNYELIDKTIDTISIYALPSKVDYNIGQSLDLTNGRIKLTYTDGTSSPISMKKYGVVATGFDSSEKGIKTINLTYKEKETSFDIEVFLKGDINEDDKVDATDLLLVKRHIVSGSKTEWVLKDRKFKLSDITFDNKIDATDLLLVKREVLKFMKQ